MTPFDGFEIPALVASPSEAAGATDTSARVEAASALQTDAEAMERAVLYLRRALPRLQRNRELSATEAMNELADHATRLRAKARRATR